MRSVLTKFLGAFGVILIFMGASAWMAGEPIGTLFTFTGLFVGIIYRIIKKSNKNQAEAAGNKKYYYSRNRKPEKLPRSTSKKYSKNLTRHKSEEKDSIKVRVCPECGTENHLYDFWCSNCGITLSVNTIQNSTNPQYIKEQKLIAKGKELAVNSHKKEASACFAKAISINPYNSETWLCLAEVVNDPEKSQDCYDRAQKLSSNNSGKSRSSGLSPKLSANELRVLKQMYHGIQGFYNPTTEIANDHKISLNEALHLQSMLRKKLDCSNNKVMVKFAIDHGYIQKDLTELDPWNNSSSKKLHTESVSKPRPVSKKVPNVNDGSSIAEKAITISIICVIIGLILIFVIAPKHQYENIYLFGYAIGKRESADYLALLSCGGGFIFIALITFISALLKD